MVGGVSRTQCWEVVSIFLPLSLLLGLAVVFVAAWSACQRSTVTGGYFHKLLQFLEPSCIALASLVTANGACVAGCGPREAAELAGSWGRELRRGGGRLSPVSSSQTPGRRSGCTLSARSLLWKSCWHQHFGALFLFLFLFIARLLCMAGEENFHSPLCAP